MAIEIVAFAATAGNQLGADLGIQITEYDPAGDVHTELLFIDGDPGLDEDGDLDEDNADAILESNGFSRVDPWHLSGGQWGAMVERLGA